VSGPSHRQDALGPLESKHALSSFASSTPATDGKLVFVSFLEVDYDFDGNQKWLVKPGNFISAHGYCASPVLFENLVIVNGDHDGDSYLVALDKQTGKTVWKLDREHKIRRFATPLIREIDGRTQMVLSGSKHILSVSPRNGSQHWVVQGPKEQFVASIRTEVGFRLVQYIVPLTVAGDDEVQASYSPDFNETISKKAILWPQVRARQDAERVCLVSVERHTGWFHDLFFPGYHWADTEGKWLVPGMTYHDGMGSYVLENPRLVAAFELLQRQETAPGRWGLGGTKLPFGDELQGRFPLVGRFLDKEGQPAVSRQAPNRVAGALKGAFDET
jgi:hypothetical protein